jgi:zinc transport system ATP-binding protein
MTTTMLHSPLLTARNLRVPLKSKEGAEHLNFDLRRGEITTLIGGTAKDRHSILRTLLGLDEAGDVRVWRDPRIILGYAPAAMTQEAQLPLSAARFARMETSVSTSDAAEIFSFIGISEHARTPLHDLPEDIIQKVTLARAMMRKADLIVLEEPGAFGLEGRADFFSLLSKTKDRLGCGMLVASHDLNIIMAQSNRVICIEGGGACQGEPLQAVAAHALRGIVGADRASHLAIYQHNSLHEGAEAPQPIRIDTAVSAAS